MTLRRRLVIDGSNIRQGGGVTHLSRVLAAADPAAAGFRSVVILASRYTLSALIDRPWLEKRSDPRLDGGLLARVFWQQTVLPRLLRQMETAILFSPGGTTPYRCPVPVVTMSQNMLPFEPEEAVRFGRFSPMRLKLNLLQRSQGRSFRTADGLIFLTRYARDRLAGELGLDLGRTALIPHGIEERFFRSPRASRAIEMCGVDAPFRFLYVSILMPYKHQVEVAHAVARLRGEGVPLAIDFVGPSWGNYGIEFRALLKSLDPSGAFLRWGGEVPFEDLHAMYGAADAFVFASSCENLPNILVEAMAAGLPILSSDRGPMPEVLGDAGDYFDPCSTDSLVSALRSFLASQERRNDLAKAAQERARRYSWARCAADTFEFLARIAEARRP